MKMSTPYGVCVLAGALALAVVPGAAASTEVDLTVSGTTVTSGQVLTVSATSPTTCRWEVTWNGEHRRATGGRIETTFVAPRVTVATEVLLTAACFPGPPAPAATPSTSTTPTASKGRAAAEPPAGPAEDPQALVVRIPDIPTATVPVVVEPADTETSPPDDGAGGHGGLPDTGGPALGLLVAAIGALLLGAAAVRSGGRKDPVAG